MAILTHVLSYSKSFLSLRKRRQTHHHRPNDNAQPLLETQQSTGEDNKKIDDQLTKVKVSDEKLYRKLYATNRLYNEFEIIDDEIIQCSYGPRHFLDPFHLEGIIVGPSGTPFEGGIFTLSIDVPKDYPFKPPKIKFLTKVFHPNVASDGTIAIDILNSNWSAALTLQRLLLSICSFLPDPSHERDSCNPVCDLYWNDKKAYNEIARQWTLKYAMC